MPKSMRRKAPGATRKAEWYGPFVVKRPVQLLNSDGTAHTKTLRPTQRFIFAKAKKHVGGEFLSPGQKYKAFGMLLELHSPGGGLLGYAPGVSLKAAGIWDDPD
jgi:hypothetical protein